MARTYSNKNNTPFNAIPGLTELRAQLVRENAEAEARSQRASHAGIMSAASRGTLSRKLVDKSVHEDVRGCVKPPVRSNSRVIVRESKPESLDKVARLAREQAQGKPGSTHRLHNAVLAVSSTKAVAAVIEGERERVAVERELSRKAKATARRLNKLRANAEMTLRKAQRLTRELEAIRASGKSFKGNYWELQRGARRAMRNAFVAEHKYMFARKPGNAFEQAPWAEMPNRATLRVLRTPAAQLMLDQDYAPGEFRRS